MSVMLLLAIASVFLMQKVTINNDMTKYLADDSPMKIGMDIMEEEFPEMETSQTIRVMFQDLNSEQKMELLTELKDIKYVDTVDYDIDSEDYNKDNHTLYILNTSYAYGSDEEISIETALDENFNQYDMIYQNGDTSFGALPAWIICLAFAILMIILFIMCNSWIEPFLFLVTIGVAIVINMGTNIVMGSISNITFSISAILQLVLSMDYSIILMNRYRQEKQLTDVKEDAMKKALVHAFSSITGSSLTTIVGLLALAFMSFKIGMDLGFVLAKGVLISMLCIFTVLPFLILISDKLIQKTTKKVLEIPMNKVAAFSYRFRYVLTALFVVMFIGFYILQGNTETAYTLENEDPIADIFPSSNMLVMVHDNQDEEKVAEIAEELEKDPNIKQVMGYTNTLGKDYTAKELVDVIDELGSDMNLDSSLINMLYYSYFADGKLLPMTVSDFLKFISDDVMKNEAFADYFHKDMEENVEMIQKFSDVDSLAKPMNAEELADFFDMDTDNIEQLFLLYQMKNGITGTVSMTLPTFATFVADEVASKEEYSSLFDNETLSKMEMLKTFTAVSGKTYTPAEMYQLLASVSDQLDKNTIELLYLYYASTIKSDPTWTMTIGELLDYLVDDILKDPRFATMLDADMSTEIEGLDDQLNEEMKQLKGSQHSRIIISMIYSDESPETTAFLKKLTSLCDEKLTGDYYLIGNSAMTYEMQQTFDKEMLFITLLTAIAIFIVIALTFRSIIIPAILVLLVQCGVYITVTIIGLQGYSIYFLALLIVECILMGATIDYGILFTNYYREKRHSMGVKEALHEAYNGSIHTIMTSGLIIVLVVGIVGNCFSNPVIGQICKTLSTGALCASLLILFILPGLLATFDKMVIRKNKEQKMIENSR